VARITANGTFDSNRGLVHGKPTRAFKRSMTLFGTNLAKLILLERTVQKRQLSKLLLLVHILFIINHD
jgi:hypothetical protein